jgi:hypothetical protein
MSAQQQPDTVNSRPKEGAGTNVLRADAALLPAPETVASAPVPTTATPARPSAAGIPVTMEDKQELAKFLFEQPKDEKVGFETYVELFRRTVRTDGSHQFDLIWAH